MTIYALYNPPDNPISFLSFSKVMYPENHDPRTQKPILPLPHNGLSIPAYYLIEEQQGRGVISHEYCYDDDFFHIKTYFTRNEKKLILHMRHALDSKNSELAPYDHCQNYWYGGYFAKKDDILSWTPKQLSTRKKRKFEAAVGLFAFALIGGTPSNANGCAPVPPLEPNTGMADTWQTQAEIVFVDTAQDDAAHIQQKKEFNNKLIENLTSGTPLHTTIKQLDAQAKLIDSIVAVAYHHDYQDCTMLRVPGLLTTLTDEASIKHYLCQYNHSNEASRNRNLSHHLTVTNELATMLQKKLEKSTYTPLPDLQETLQNLEVTCNKIEAKEIVSLPNTTDTLITEQQNEIIALRNKVDQSGEEIKNLTEKVTMLIALLSPNNK